MLFYSLKMCLTFCVFVEKNPVKQIHDVMVAITTEDMISRDNVMSNTVYIKNFCNTLIKQKSANKI